MADSIKIDVKSFEEEGVHQPIKVEFTALGTLVILELPKGCNKMIIDAHKLKKISDFFSCGIFR